jgi:hypothetical protein
VFLLFAFARSFSLFNGIVSLMDFVLFVDLAGRNHFFWFTWGWLTRRKSGWAACRLPLVLMCPYWRAELRPESVSTFKSDQAISRLKLQNSRRS